jgi:hypothetical protein
MRLLSYVVNHFIMNMKRNHSVTSCGATVPHNNKVDAIKNPPWYIPEGRNTVLDAPMCNGGLVLPTRNA